jgi:hypothetical protein
VPWADEPLAPYTAPQPAPVTYPTSAPLCRAGQLRINPGRSGAAAGNLSSELIFVNTGAKTCLLRGSPQLTAVRNGKRVTLLARPHDTFFGDLDPSDLRPGGFTLLRIHTTDVCNKPAQHLTGVQVVLPNEQLVDAPASIKLDDSCGLGVSDFGVPRRYKQQTAGPGTPGTLKATLDLPASAKSATTLDYTVTLANPTDTTVKLTPCPGYTQGAFAQGYALRLSYRLNCKTVRTIAPGKSVTYAMQLDLPQTKRDVDTKFAWGLDTPVGPYAAGTLSVRAG